MANIIMHVFPFYRRYKIKRLQRSLDIQREYLETLVYCFNEPRGIAYCHFVHLGDFTNTQLLAMAPDVLKIHLQQACVELSAQMHRDEAKMHMLLNDYHFFKKMIPRTLTRQGIVKP